MHKNLFKSYTSPSILVIMLESSKKWILSFSYISNFIFILWFAVNYVKKEVLEVSRGFISFKTSISSWSKLTDLRYPKGNAKLFKKYTLISILKLLVR